MTVPSVTSVISYPGTGVQTAFAYPFLIPSNSDGTPAGVVAVIDAAGVTTFVNPSSYSLTGIDNPSGGIVVYPLFGAPLPSTEKIVIIRNLGYVQDTSVANQGFFPATLEDMGDYMTMLSQQLNERAGRTVSAPPGETMGFLPGASQRAGLFLSFDGAGNPIAVPGTGGGGGTAWAALTGVPPIIASFDNLTPGAGQIVEYTSPTTAHLIPTPGGGGGGNVLSVNGRVGNVILDATDIDGAPTFGQAVKGILLAGANMTVSAADPVTGAITLTAAGGGGAGNMQPRLLSTLGAIDGGGVNTAGNDAAFAAAEAAGDTAFYIPDGVYATTRSEALFAKHYVGRGVIKFPGTGNDVLPARYTYLATKAPGAGGIGRQNWFAGGNQFVEQEYSVIGPNVRTFDLAAVYYDSTTIPHNSWMDVNSGNSGAQAWITAGVAVGATLIPLGAPADASWVGKTVGFANTFGGATVESHVVTAVNTAGNNITINAPLTHTYVWNPSASLTPNINFGFRTWAGHDYVLMRGLGGGDMYGHNVRMQANYSAKPTEVHPFLAGTFSQYGGDVNAGGDGIYLQCWESQILDNGHSISGIAFVQSFTRTVDNSLNNGTTWGGTFFQSTGSKPADFAHGVLGFWRNGLDTVFATFTENSTITANAAIGSAAFTVMTTNGAHPGDPVIIDAEQFTIQNVTSLTTFTTTAASAVAHNIGALVSYTKGGAALNHALGQRHVWNSSLSATQRGGDPLGVFSTPYGNVQGDIITESGTDGAGNTWWDARVARGTTAAAPDIARIRVRGNGAGLGLIQIFGTGTHTIAGLGLGFAAGCNINMSLNNNINWGNCYMYSDGVHIYATNNGGGSFTMIV